MDMEVLYTVVNIMCNVCPDGKSRVHVQHYRGGSRGGGGNPGGKDHPPPLFFEGP